VYSERAWDKMWLHILANGAICVPTDCTVTINWGLVLGGTGTIGTVTCKPPRPSMRVDTTQNATEGSGGGIPDHPDGSGVRASDRRMRTTGAM